MDLLSVTQRFAWSLRFELLSQFKAGPNAIYKQMAKLFDWFAMAAPLNLEYSTVPNIGRLI